MPPPVLAGCTEPLVDGAPGLRGLWEVVAVEVNRTLVPRDGHRVYGMLQRIEQAGDRMVVTGGGAIHDMRCDGTAERGVNDVAERDYKTKTTVVAPYGGGVHVLRPVGIPIEVTRRLGRRGDSLGLRRIHRKVAANPRDSILRVGCTMIPEGETITSTATAFACTT